MKYLWIGLTRTTQNGELVLQWDDGFHTAFTNWGINQPSTNEEMKWTVMDQDGSWFLISDHLPVEYPFICQMHIHVNEIVPNEDYRGEQLECSHHHYHDTSWHEYGSWCFRAEPNKLTFAEGNAICQSQSVPSHLASIHSQDENNQLTSLIKERVEILVESHII